ncbi:MAG TPA: 2-oxo acid dehydrogenase subunit E2 [Candidatus Hydrogenedentes bacterium]|nr:2-oxo acid dehydrogenase subunit E2 [Candidatus Hydrogenedentota bacterium]HPG66622.1 2-oxo acid dehydrogenase subunit E2 [Candidatus Hydrogenedentota bacterium]
MHEVKLPQLGQSVEEADIVQWLKKEGDPVAEGDPICSVQTDKAEIEVECSASGILRKILVPENTTVPVLTVIALVGEADEPMPDLAPYATGAAPSDRDADPSPEVHVEAAPAAASTTAAEPGRPFVSPRARKKAAELKICPTVASGTGVRGRVMEADIVGAAALLAAIRITPTAQRLAALKGVDITRVSGTGPAGKITKADIERAVAAPATRAPSAAASADKRVPLTPMRSIIARRMSESKYKAPHYYITVEVDISAAATRFRNGGLPFRPSYNDIVLAATVKALTEYPGVNAKWDTDAIIELADVNLGVAVALPTGLIVPVIRQAQRLDMQGIHEAARTLTEKARTGKLMPDDYTGNTFTVSNLGVYGVDHFTAIINQPDSAILAVGQIKDRPVVIDGGIHIRPMVKMTLSSDHRVIDGALAAQFMGRLKEILEAADL